MIDWKQIETAPKDRRIIISYGIPIFTGISVIFGKFDADESARNPKPYWRHDMSLLELGHARKPTELQEAMDKIRAVLKDAK